MYGLVHCSVREMLTEQHGEQTALDVIQAAGVPSDVLLTMKSYEDEITLSLVKAAARHLGQPLDRFLIDLGYYWMTRFAPQTYGGLLEQAGGDLVTFLNHLNPLHDRIGTSFVNFAPPLFEVNTFSDTVVELHYASHRHGLKFFLEGILAGLCDHLRQPAVIEETSYTSSESGDSATYRITLETGAAHE